jgi:hypothetical protein
MQSYTMRNCSLYIRASLYGAPFLYFDGNIAKMVTVSSILAPELLDIV